MKIEVTKDLFFFIGLFCFCLCVFFQNCNSFNHNKIRFSGAIQDHIFGTA